MIGRLILSLCSFLLSIAVCPAFAQQNEGVALLIGNAAYPDAEAPLKEPVSDARALGDELKRRGFAVDIGENLKKEAMQRALEKFYGKIKPTSTVVIFFSGFGIQSDRQSYMIPVDARIWSEGDVRRDGFSLDKVLTEITGRGANVKIAIVDASRRNPYERRFRAVSAGLAAITAPSGTVVMISAPLDTVISDGRPPVFVAELIKELKVSDATIEQIFNRTRMGVSRATKGQQVPWFSSSLEEDVPLVASSQPTASPPATSGPAAKASSAAATSGPTANAPTATPSAGPIANAMSETASSGPNGKAPPAAPLDKQAEPSASEPKMTPAKTAKLPAPEHDNSNDLASYYERGQRYALNGDFALAIKDFDEVIRRDPKHTGALNDRCWAEAMIGALHDALADCNEALRISPSYMDALDSRGMVNLKLGMLKMAIADYDAALRIDPKHAASLYGRGIAKLRSGNVDGGNSDISAAKTIQPTIANEFAGYGIR
jgi:Flp pilus assembly protein TadD